MFDGNSQPSHSNECIGCGELLGQAHDPHCPERHTAKPPPLYPVTLTHAQHRTCYELGRARRADAERRGQRQPNHDPRPSSLIRDTQGLIGEGVLAADLGMWDWFTDNAVGPIGGLDVPPYDVRTTLPGRGMPLHRPETHEDAPHVLVYVGGSWPNFSRHASIAGWAYLAGLRQKRYWRDDWPSPAYCVPPDSGLLNPWPPLNPPATL